MATKAKGKSRRRSGAPKEATPAEPPCRDPGPSTSAAAEAAHQPGYPNLRPGGTKRTRAEIALDVNGGPEGLRTRYANMRRNLLTENAAAARVLGCERGTWWKMRRDAARVLEAGGPKTERERNLLAAVGAIELGEEDQRGEVAVRLEASNDPANLRYLAEKRTRDAPERSTAAEIAAAAEIMAQEMVDDVRAQDAEMWNDAAVAALAHLLPDATAEDLENFADEMRIRFSDSELGRHPDA